MPRTVARDMPRTVARDMTDEIQGWRTRPGEGGGGEILPGSRSGSLGHKLSLS